MDEMEEKLGAILGTPQMMQQIMAMAQAMNQESSSAPHQEPESVQSSFPVLDPALLQKLSGLAGSGVDSNQQALLQALEPYLSQTKVGKLERAMRASKMARLASGFLGQGGLSLLTGR